MLALRLLRAVAGNPRGLGIVKFRPGVTHSLHINLSGRHTKPGQFSQNSLSPLRGKIQHRATPPDRVAVGGFPTGVTDDLDDSAAVANDLGNL